MMSEKGKIKATDLMKLHVEALFTQNRFQRLLKINEPWPGSPVAPKFFLGRTVDGTVIIRYRHDIPDRLIKQLDSLCNDERLTDDINAQPRHFSSYMQLLSGSSFTMGPAFLVAEDLRPAITVISVKKDNITLLNGGFEWLQQEIMYSQPCLAIIVDNHVVSVCRSVRITTQAHEAGIETLEAFRGRGYAREVLAAWSMAVREMGCLPLYSTSSENHSSQSVARKSALILYGVSCSIT